MVVVVVWWVVAHGGVVVVAAAAAAASAPAYLFNQYFKNLQGCKVPREKSLCNRRWMILRARGW